MERQRSRKTRLRIPTWDEIQRDWPTTVGRQQIQQPTRVVWTLVCLGYQPELATAWGACGRTLATDLRDQQLEPIFSSSLFWVITRAINCPYCMGHCEMTLEGAGLPVAMVAERTRLLAGDDWSSFPTEEQHAFAFGRKLTRAPWTVTAGDVEVLKRDFGPQRALAILWSASRGNYMTRISNGFQLSLERDNVFRDRYLPAPGPGPDKARSERAGN